MRFTPLYLILALFAAVLSVIALPVTLEQRALDLVDEAPSARDLAYDLQPFQARSLSTLDSSAPIVRELAAEELVTRAPFTDAQRQAATRGAQAIGRAQHRAAQLHAANRGVEAIRRQRDAAQRQIRAVAVARLRGATNRRSGEQLPAYRPRSFEA
ncbi:hypothetical protein FA15DRAFT_672257 [Coprinopsis marcescibilis]|uniref:Uncharacterized protein n=1 Tax=Coprinopsis marcescibilis TaxID=230819 RepID=A0A5C3L0G8_COPMA|nr:hypothetical protein FA15DRAFT_672257 [Coprinopsis marcescibilis]